MLNCEEISNNVIQILWSIYNILFGRIHELVGIHDLLNTRDHQQIKAVLNLQLKKKVSNDVGHKGLIAEGL